MKKKVSIYFLTIFFFLFQTDRLFSQINNSIIISVGDYAITRLDLLKEIKLIAILSNTQINDSNQEHIKALAVKSLIKRNIKKSEIKKRNIDRYNVDQLNVLIDNSCKKLGVDRNGLKEILKRHNLSFINLEKRFKTDLKWNYMIYKIYKNKITLNAAEIENKIKLNIKNSKDINDKKDVDIIKERIVNAEKENKLKMYSNLHYSNLERSIQIKFL